MHYLDETIRLLSELDDEDLVRTHRYVKIMTCLNGRSLPRSANRSMSEIWLGKRVKFGRFPKSTVHVFEDYCKDDDPLTWTVLDMHFDALRRPSCKALLLSETAIEFRAYDPGFGDLSWEESHLRDWLNRKFALKAFQDAEAERIVETWHDPCPKAGGGRSVVWDRVFLLNEDELTRYLPGYGKRICRDKNGVPSRWWLRGDAAMCDSKDLALCVDERGEVTGRGASSWLRLGVRPAMWVTLETPVPILEKFEDYEEGGECLQLDRIATGLRFAEEAGYER